MRDFWEYASFVVTALALPVAIFFFMLEQRKERNNEEEEAYQLLSDAYNDFLKVVLANPDLHLRTNEPLESPTREQNERTMIIYDMLISLFERAYIVAWDEDMSEVEARRWNSWDRACLPGLCKMRCESKRSCARRKTQPGWRPARLCNTAHGLFGRNPKGTG